MGSDNHRVVIGLRKVRRIAPDLDALRMRLGLEKDLSIDLDQLLSLNDHLVRRPVCVLMHDKESTPERAVIFFERRILGLATGVLRAGDHAGDGAVIAPADRRTETLLEAVDVLLKYKRFHTIFGAVSHPEAEVAEVVHDPGFAKAVTSRTVRRRLQLAPTYEETIAAFGRNMRKTLRSKRRRFEGRPEIQFLPSMAPTEARQAMLSLCSQSNPARTKWEVESRYQFLCKHHSSAFAMGLRVKDGPWMSQVTGWRVGDVTYVSQAMHNLQFRSDSLGNVMSSLLIENEIGLGQKQVEWVGGVTELWARVCEAETCLCVTRSRSGFRSAFIDWISARLQRQTALEYYKHELNPDGDEESRELEPEPVLKASRSLTAQPQSLTSSLR